MTVVAGASVAVPSLEGASVAVTSFEGVAVVVAPPSILPVVTTTVVGAGEVTASPVSSFLAASASPALSFFTASAFAVSESPVLSFFSAPSVGFVASSPSEPSFSRAAEGSPCDESDGVSTAAAPSSAGMSAGAGFSGSVLILSRLSSPSCT